MFVVKSTAKMEEQLLIQEIHHAFENPLAGMIEGEMIHVDLLEHKPQGITVRDFSELVREYALYYPQNNFVTESQVGHICLKYGLVMGPSNLFTESVPERNKAEIERFKLLDRHIQVPKTESAWDFMVRKMTRSRVDFQTSEISGRYSFRIRTGKIPLPNPNWGPPEVIPLGDGFILMQKPTDPTAYLLFAKVDVLDSEIMVFGGEIQSSGNALSISYGLDTGVAMTWNRVQRGVPEYVCDAELEIQSQNIEFINNFNFRQHTLNHIVAPEAMFDHHKGYIEKVDGYKLRYRQQPQSPAARMSIDINDPIVLQPVYGGYLVVSKWGLESTMLEVQSPSLN